MNVQQLIRELQAMPPGVEVRVLVSEVVIDDEIGEHRMGLDERYAEPADEVRHCGPYVLIRSR